MYLFAKVLYYFIVFIRSVFLFFKSIYVDKLTGCNMSVCLSYKEEEDWGRSSFQSGVDSTSSICTEEEEEEEETR